MNQTNRASLDDQARLGITDSAFLIGRGPPS
ncbi:hypothetical protein SAMN06265222_114105 [Neorhodopirellula lusitana]|uniref:Uncharacterized protein n=1 Tax=Neorhodopirellula lusitana TaxID=445327 RepID=A0ABY1QI80_9BACT|nr:hypothetical protein SAMN06265222_114105 [Neorhodopirellula lusitana]